MKVWVVTYFVWPDTWEIDSVFASADAARKRVAMNPRAFEMEEHEVQG